WLRRQHRSSLFPYTTLFRSAPGMMAYTAFATPYNESLYSAYVRMFYQKTWDGILATQVEIRHLLWGEILWAGFRGAANVTVVARSEEHTSELQSRENLVCRL